MPLLDHFRPPLSETRPWESFHATWCGSLADRLNGGLLPEHDVALEQVHSGAAVEVDAEASRDVWTPAAAPLVLPAEFPARFAVEIHSTEGGRTLVAAIELVSPGDKDCDAGWRAFAAKCAAYLARGVGLVVIDVVTTRTANLHDELAALLGWGGEFRSDGQTPLYSAAYRPLADGAVSRVECWLNALEVGADLPTVPLSLSAEWCLALDLEAAYRDACRRRRLDPLAPGGG